MAITFAGAGTKAEAASGGITLNAPSNPQNDDVWIAVIHSSDQVAHTLSGWTEIVQGNGGGTTSRLSVWWFRYAGSTPNLAVGHTAGQSPIGAIASFRGVKTSGSPVNVAGTITAGAASTTIAHSAINPTVAGSALLVINGAADDNNRTALGGDYAIAFEDPAGGTQNCYVTTLGNPDGSISIFYDLSVPTGTTGTINVTQGAADPYASVLVALELAPVVTSRTTEFSGTGTVATARSHIIPRVLAATASGTLSTTATKFKGRTTAFGAAGTLATSGTVSAPEAAQVIGGGFGAWGELAYGQAQPEAVAVAVSTAFTAAGSLATQRAHIIARATAYNAAGALATTAKIIHGRATAFNAAGSLATARTITSRRSTAFNSVGSLSTSATIAGAVVPVIGGGFGAWGELAYGDAVLPQVTAATTFSAAGSLATVAAHIIHRTSLFTAIGSFATTRTRVIHRSALYAASGSLATDGATTHRRATAFNAVGSMSSAASVSGTFARTTLFTAVGSLATQRAHIIHRSATFTAAGSLVTARTITIHRTTTFAAAGTLATTRTRTARRTTLFSAIGSLTIVARRSGQTEFTAAGNLATVAHSIFRRRAAFSAAASASMTYTATRRRRVTVVASGSMTAAYVPFAPRRFLTAGGARRRFYEVRRPVQPTLTRPLPSYRRENVG